MSIYLTHKKIDDSIFEYLIEIIENDKKNIAKNINLIKEILSKIKN